MMQWYTRKWSLREDEKWKTQLGSGGSYRDPMLQIMQGSKFKWTEKACWVCRTQVADCVGSPRMVDLVATSKGSLPSLHKRV